VNSLAYNAVNPRLLATASGAPGAGTVRVWDERKLAEPLYKLDHHTDVVDVVSCAPAPRPTPHATRAPSRLRRGRGAGAVDASSSRAPPLPYPSPYRSPYCTPGMSTGRRCVALTIGIHIDICGSLTRSHPSASAGGLWALTGARAGRRWSPHSEHQLASGSQDRMVRPAPPCPATAVRPAQTSGLDGWKDGCIGQ
jgi:hypothetical protein